MSARTEPLPPDRVEVSRRGLQLLADTLWEQRRVVERLLYRLFAARLFLTAGERRFLPLALQEVDDAVEALRAAEVRRDTVVAQVAEALGVPVEALTLQELAAAAPEPIASVFTDHRTAFLTLAEEVDAVSKENQALVHTALGGVRESLEVLAGGGAPAAATYTADGRQGRAYIPSVRLDRAL